MEIHRILSFSQGIIFKGRVRRGHHCSGGSSQSMLSGPAVLVPLGGLLKMQFFPTHHRPPESEWVTLYMGMQQWMFLNSSRRV